MRNSSFEEISHRNSVPILSWDFHYEYVNELKAICTDLKKVNQISNKFTWNEKNLEIKERIKEEVILVTDLDLKIVFASNGIKRMTGYKEEEILGKTPKMFQGPATSETVLKEMKEAIQLLIPFDKTIENYKKNGDSYRCKINVFPIYNLKGQVSHFIAFEKQDLSA
ncbi:PAS domain-containing protein [Flavobacterium sp. MC2016-06]|jgi:PAS domain S-box-containing protein|uniref:PAS domain-containing protein n=1 Tax=Flavobacterium sp. MC2016-06 TaxID=2676308 RepID=UPI0012BAB802|nr:PAS domain-containing protein [Flavobacterium sp. MC2016-06]MBU3862158.1 PAS domain-containing protein [Flavobacterium sp. MC2016-06]